VGKKTISERGGINNWTSLRSLSMTLLDTVWIPGEWDYVRTNPTKKRFLSKSPIFGGVPDGICTHNYLIHGYGSYCLLRIFSNNMSM